MKNCKIASLVLVVPFSVALSCAGYAAGNEVMVPWHSVPAAVQNTVIDSTKGQQVGTVEKEIKDGATIYETKVVNADGSRLVIKVAENGTLAEIKKKSAEVEIPWKSVPAAAQKTMTKNAAGKPIGVVEKETVKGNVAYEGSVLNEDNSQLVIKVTQDGTLISTKTRKGYPGQKMQKHAKISISDARVIALKAQPGQITDEELEKEKGGSGLRYSFDVKTDKGVREVGVDSVTGAVLENSTEGVNPD